MRRVTQHLSGIRFQILLPAVLVAAVTITTITAYMYFTLRREVYSEVLTRAHTISRVLAGSAQETILNRDRSAIQGFIDEYKTLKGISFIFIVDENSQVLVHTFTPAFPKEFHWPAEAGEKKAGSRPVKWNNRNFMDISYPVMAGAMGFVHIVVDEDALLAEARNAAKNVLLLSLVFGLMGWVVTFLLLNRLVLAIGKFTATIKEIALEGNLDLKVPSSRVREIAELGNYFSEMVWHIKAERSSLEDKVRERTHELNDTISTLEETRTQLVTSSKMSALGEMAGGVAHEINNPLAVIKLVSSQLKEVIEDPEIDRALVRQMADDVEKTTDRIAKIVTGLRSFSRDGSKDPFTNVNLRQLIEETLAFCGQRFKNGGTELTIEDYPADLHFEGRPTEISQVLLNLLNNANDAIATLEKKWIRVTARETDGIFELTVTDSGPGISPEVQKKIFQPFFTTKEIGKGTGMGLSISMRIIRNHQGELTLDERCPNTRFVVRIPSVQGKQKAA